MFVDYKRQNAVVNCPQRLIQEKFKFLNALLCYWFRWYEKGRNVRVLCFILKMFSFGIIVVEYRYKKFSDTDLI